MDSDGQTKSQLVKFGKFTPQGQWRTAKRTNFVPMSIYEHREGANCTQKKFNKSNRYPCGLAAWKAMNAMDALGLVSAALVE